MPESRSSRSTPPKVSFQSILSFLRIKWPEVLLLILGFLGSIKLYRSAYGDSQDFMVYWRAANSCWNGQSPYLFSKSDLGFVFKYPPFLLPLFLPLSWLPELPARVLWATLELLTIGYSIRWLILNQVRPRVAFFTAALFWWIWLAHFFAGQFTLFMLWIALICSQENPKPSWKTSFQSTTLAAFFSAKVFTLFTLFGAEKRFRNARTLLLILLSFVVSHGIVLWVINSHLAPGQPPMDLSTLYHQWALAAGSGGAELGAEVVRGQGNHGFTAGILRWTQLNSFDSKWDMITSFFLAVFFGLLWHRSSSLLRFQERWAGWLGIGIIVLPLAWHHSFVLAYPLCALALERALQSKNKNLIGLALLGSICIGIFVPQAIGPTLVKPLELVSVKSWGVCFAALALVLSSKKMKKAKR